MLEAVKRKLQAEVEALNHELSVTLPEALKKAIALGDLRENGDYHAALERQQFVQARLSHLRSRLVKLSSVDLSKVPADRVGLGSRIEVEDLDTGDTETWELVIPDAMDVDAGQISVSSPLGRGLMEKSEGETAEVRLPASVRRLKIRRLQTLHQLAAELAHTGTGDHPEDAPGATKKKKQKKAGTAGRSRKKKSSGARRTK